MVETKTNYYIFSSKCEKLYVKENNHQYEIGDILEIKGNKTSLSFTRYESDFDFKTYLNKKGVYSEIIPLDIKVNFYIPIRINKVKNNFLNNFDAQTASLIRSILFASDDGYFIDNNVKALHLNRLLSTSGIYLYIFYGFFSFIFSIFMKKKWGELVSTLILLPYIIFLFPKFSILRIYILLISRWINKYVFKKKLSNYALISINAFFFLIIDYHFVYNDGFYLGYFIPIIAIFISNAIKTKRNLFKKLIVGVLIFIYFIPFEISYSNEINLLSYPFQIILIPYFAVYSLSALFCFFGIPIYQFNNLLTEGLKVICNFLTPLSIHVPKMNDLYIFIYNSLYFISLYYYNIRYKFIYKHSISLFMISLTLYFLPINNLISEQVTFINVGQGDACLIRKGTNTVLIDTGGSLYKDIANDVLIPFFKSNRLYKIDLLITTHDDYDHIGAEDELIKNFHINKIVNSSNLFPIKIGDIEFTNYNYSYSYDDSNINSLVIGFHLCNLDFLITGDAPISVEKEIIKKYKNIPCDILKVGHHGSNTSTSKEFLEFLSPKEAVISVGKNYYGHPSEEVITRLKRYKIKIRETLLEGSIKYSSFINT